MRNTTHRYSLILKTYERRPWVLLLGLLFLICFANLAFMPRTNRFSDLYPEPEHTGKLHFVHTSVENIQAERGSPDRQQTLDDLLSKTKASSIRSLCVLRMQDDDPFPDLSQVPNLSYLKLSGIDLTEEIVTQILQLPKLKSLELTGQVLSAHALERFGQKVTALQLRSQSLEKYINELPKMSAVRLLTVEYEALSPELIPAIATIPNLEQLAFVPRDRQQGSVNPLDLPPSVQATLRTHPTLKAIYADWGNLPDENPFENQPLLPLRTFPLQYSSETISSLGGAVFAICVLMGLILSQLWVQFVVPAASVVPGYLRPHRRVAIALLGLGSLLIWLSLWRYELDLLAGLSLVLVPCGLISLYVLICMIENRVLKNWIVPVLVVACFTTPVILIQLPIGAKSGFLWYMYGQFPSLAITVSLLSLAILAFGFRQLPLLNNRVNEKFSSLPLLSWSSTQCQWPDEKQCNTWLMRLLDRRYGPLAYRSRTTLQMVSLWRIGNLLRPIYILVLMVFVMLFSLLPPIVMHFIAGEPLVPVNSEFLGGIFAGPISMGFLLPIFGWWQRGRSLESESLKPLSRVSLCKQLYLSLAFDHWIVWISMFGFLGHRTTEAPGGWVELGGLLILLGIAAPLWIIGVSSCVLIFKRAWVVLANMIGLYALTAIGIGIAYAFGTSAVPGSLFDMQLLYLVAILALVAAIALNLIMYRALLKREWG
ncbi:MAG: hypothetical protein HUJ26_01760 [Planctomycetaceae bacterium]|nr:hypothetical protein [Planctomycetaceae bacterium]